MHDRLHYYSYHGEVMIGFGALIPRVAVKNILGRMCGLGDFIQLHDVTDFISDKLELRLSSAHAFTERDGGA